ncbi:MAG TPA: DUF3597 domain-containing protein [Reyranella sp.]|nr:DUF3597 domain-containing protein [Reyranella sp.]
MSIFGKIKDAIFGHKARAQTPVATAQPNEVTGVSPDFQGTVTNQPTSTRSAPVSEVDVERNLAEMAHGKALNWRTSIVDLMKLLGIDSSLDNRKELARELGYTGDLDGSAEMNIWLHKKTMQELAANGGKVPAELTD